MEEFSAAMRTAPIALSTSSNSWSRGLARHSSNMTVDARNRLVASELERRWTRDVVRDRSPPAETGQPLMEKVTHYPPNEGSSILAMGDNSLRYGKASDRCHRQLKDDLQSCGGSRSS